MKLTDLVARYLSSSAESAAQAANGASTAPSIAGADVPAPEAPQATEAGCSAGSFLHDADYRLVDSFEEFLQSEPKLASLDIETTGLECFWCKGNVRSFGQRLTNLMTALRKFFEVNERTGRGHQRIVSFRPKAGEGIGEASSAA